ncbi:MAG: hypothetical protein M0Q54_07735 [Pigmentiphaga sp.]|nr:hypothetical protein [Pigmentiphaga sp.]
MTWQTLFGEQATTKIAAAFDTEQQAKIVAEALRDRAQLLPGQVRTVRPGERKFGRKLEPESRGIARTAIRAHSLLGLAGLALGFVIWLLLYLSGIAAIVASPGLSALAFLFFGAMAGMLLGGLITARPDHQFFIKHVRTASDEGRWSLVIHPLDPPQCDAVLRVLGEEGAEAVRTV